MKNEVTKTSWTCDVCGKSCYPMQTFEHASGYTPVERAGVTLSFGTFGLCVGKDICGTCACEAMRDCIDKIHSGAIPEEPPKPFTAPMGA